MKGKKTLQDVRKRQLFQHLKRYCRKHFAVIMPVLVLMVLMVCAFQGEHQDKYFIQRDEDRNAFVCTEAGETLSTEKEYQELHIGLMGIVNCAKCMKQYTRAASMIETASPNEEILIGAVGVSRAEHRRGKMEQGFAKVEMMLPDVTQIIRENQMPPEEYYTLLRIVEAEATGEDFEGKRLIANVILNRVKDEHFPNTIEEVVWQQEGGSAQFQPTVDGRIYSVEITDETIRAVDEALSGVDESHGAVFFMARSGSEESNIDWFDENLTRLFAHGGHEYFTWKGNTQV